MPDRAVVDERQEAYETVKRHLKEVMAYNDVGAESLYGEATYADPDEVMAWEQVLRELEPPDRAVVECETCDGDGIVYAGDLMVGCEEYMTERPCPACRGPRAMSAISEDGQWLVVIEELDGVDQWCKYRHAGSWSPISWLFQSSIPDTGQDANDVLRELMEGRQP